MRVNKNKTSKNSTK